MKRFQCFTLNFLNKFGKKQNPPSGMQKLSQLLIREVSKQMLFLFITNTYAVGMH